MSFEIPVSLGGFGGLVHLHLHENGLTRDDPGLAGQPHQADYELYLYNNQLTGEIPEELGNLTNLQETVS